MDVLSEPQLQAVERPEQWFWQSTALQNPGGVILPRHKLIQWQE